MSDLRESRFRKKAVRDLKKLPSIKIFSISQRSIRGTADILICLNGFFVYLEFKADEKAVRAALQIYNVETTKEANGYAFFVYPENWEKVFRFLKKLSKTKRRIEYEN